MRKLVKKDIGGPQPSKMTIGEVMKDLEDIDVAKEAQIRVPVDEDGSYPQCPHGPWECPYKTMWPMFRKFGDDYMGHIPTCNLCVQWSQVKQTIQQNKHLEALARSVMLLRYTE